MGRHLTSSLKGIRGWIAPLLVLGLACGCSDDEEEPGTVSSQSGTTNMDVDQDIVLYLSDDISSTPTAQAETGACDVRKDVMLSDEFVVDTTLLTNCLGITVSTLANKLRIDPVEPLGPDKSYYLYIDKVSFSEAGDLEDKTIAISTEDVESDGERTYIP